MRYTAGERYISRSDSYRLLHWQAQPKGDRE